MPILTFVKQREGFLELCAHFMSCECSGAQNGFAHRRFALCVDTTENVNA